MKMYKCLSCGYEVSEDDAEEVPGTKNPVRRRHKTWEGCQAAMSSPVVPARQVLAGGRRTRPHPTLGQLDKKADHGHW